MVDLRASDRYLRAYNRGDIVSPAKPKLPLTRWLGLGLYRSRILFLEAISQLIGDFLNMPSFHDQWRYNR